jgi:hypothetical protein
MVRLLCLVLNRLIFGWSEEPTKNLTPCDLEDRGLMFSKLSPNRMVLQP